MYFEEIGAYEYSQMKKQHTPASSTSDEITEFIIPDQEADVFIPDDDFEE